MRQRVKQRQSSEAERTGWETLWTVSLWTARDSGQKAAWSYV